MEQIENLNEDCPYQEFSHDQKLRLTGLEIAVKIGASQDNIVPTATNIYNFILNKETPNE